MNQHEGERKRFFPFSIGSRVVDDVTPTPTRLRSLFGRIFHSDGTVNKQAEEVKDIVEFAEKNGLDAILIPTGRNTVAAIGKGIAQHKGLVVAGVGLTGTVLAGAIGFVLYKHHQESQGKK